MKRRPGGRAAVVDTDANATRAAERSRSVTFIFDVAGRAFLESVSLVADFTRR